MPSYKDPETKKSLTFSEKLNNIGEEGIFFFLVQKSLQALRTDPGRIATDL